MRTSRRVSGKPTGRITSNSLPNYDRLSIRLLALAALVSLAACTSTPTPTPTPLQPAGQGTIKVLAPIDSVEIRIAESFPPQYFVLVKSGLPNSCVKFDSYDVAQTGDTIQITVTNLKPADKGIICAQVYGTAESNIALGAEFESGKTYTVMVNDVSKTFVAQ